MTAIGIVILVLAFVALGVVIFIYTLYSLVQTIVECVHAKKNGTSYNEEEPEELEEHIDTCPHCSRDFVWDEKDIIVKYAPGRGYKVPCPYCNKLLHVYDK